MALTEIQQFASKDELYNQLQTLATEMERYLLRWEQAAEFLDNMGQADLTTLGITESAAITDLNQFKSAVDDLVSVYRGNAVTPTNNPSAVMDRIRRMLVI